MENSTLKSVLAMNAFDAFDKSLNHLKSQVRTINKSRGNRNANKLDKLATMLQSLQLLKTCIHNIHLATEISVQCANDLDSVDLFLHTVNQRKAGFSVRTDWESKVDELINEVQLMIQAEK